MNELNVLITGGGAPGIRGTLYSLKHNWDERNIKVVCVDMDHNAVGRYLCDSFYKVPPARAPDFTESLLQICKKENIDVIIPQVTAELLTLANQKKVFEGCGAKVAVSDSESIRRANNKFELLKLSKMLSVPYPKFKLVHTWDSLVEAGEEMGMPFAVKQPEGSGMRGFRIVYENLNMKDSFYSEKPDSSNITLENLHAILGEEFPELIVMEYLPGTEYTVDVLSSKSDIYGVLPRKRTKIRSGITFVGEAEQSEDIIKYTEKLTRELGLEFAHGFQFKLDSQGTPKILESNPRVQGTMVLSTIAGMNVVYGVVKLALGEEIPEFKINWNAKLIRYWGAVGLAGAEVSII